MLDMEDHIYRNRYAVKAALGLIKIYKKLDTIKEEESKRFKPEHEEYLNSKEYETLQKEISKRDNDESDLRFESDPKGFDFYKQAVFIISFINILNIIVRKPT
jgi:hypothetical protein